jgi:2-keto-4-pentenoate hydratase/2-oxohepta-3-ene-1,7-dioic acid hydratase in catechol pathway
MRASPVHRRSLAKSPPQMDLLNRRASLYRLDDSAPRAKCPSFMRVFGGFLLHGSRVYGEVHGDEVRLLAEPFWRSLDFSGVTHSLGELQIDVPVAPSKIIAVGLNYADHIKEMNRSEIGSPLIWFKAPSSLLAHEGTIEIAFPEHKTDFETELAIVIGRKAKNVSEEQALDFVFGYTVALDVSDRDLQKAEKQFSRCKSFDTYTPVGPFIYADVDPHDLPIRLQQNGETKQQARTNQMIYSVEKIVSFASESLTLEPGDLILTGTPSGVGAIAAGDELEATVGDWRPLRNRVANARVR